MSVRKECCIKTRNPLEKMEKRDETYLKFHFVTMIETAGTDKPACIGFRLKYGHYQVRISTWLLAIYLNYIIYEWIFALSYGVTAITEESTPRQKNKDGRQNPFRMPAAGASSCSGSRHTTLLFRLFENSCSTLYSC